MLAGEVAATPPKKLSPEDGLGLGTWVQVVPFQCPGSVWCGWGKPGGKVRPPAPASVAAGEVPATSPLMRPGAPGLGLGTCVQVVPFQCSINVRAPPTLS